MSDISQGENCVLHPNPFTVVSRQFYLSRIMILLREMIRKGLNTFTNLLRPYSRLFMVSDSALWVLSWEMKEVGRIAQKLGIRLAPSWMLPFTDHQSVFFGNHFGLLLNDRWFDTSCRFATAYFHGRPGTGVQEFDIVYQNLCKYHEKIHRIQVTHSEMRDLVLNSGISSEKVFLIPIGINIDYFRPQTNKLKQQAREKFGIPQQAVVVGSFQKDGVGWDDGLDPKWPKAPDILIKTLVILKEKVPDLFVLLSGPARGYVKAGLDIHKIHYRHFLLKKYPDIESLYHCLDLYIVASREEGGPKAILESMASGVPLVTTRVGQAMDLVKHGQNGWMVEIDDAEGLAFYAEKAISSTQESRRMVVEGLQTASMNTYDAHMPIWMKFFEGFVA